MSAGATPKLGAAICLKGDIERLWQKVDLRLIPLLTTMYVVAFVDKTNIGNAKIQGLTSQLALTGDQFNIILTLNFVANCAFALPANLLLKKLRPSVWLPGIAITWGIITTLHGIVKTYRQLLALRILLGIAEAGLSPGILYYLTLWYPRHMLQYRIGLFWGGAAVAGAFSGLLAYGISFMSGTAGLLGWSWIFIIEGIMSVVVGVVAAFMFVDYPRTAYFLTAEERASLVRNTLYDSSSVGEDEEFATYHVVGALLDWQVWVACLVEISIITPVYGISLFLPSIINGFGFGPAISQLLSVPPYVIGTVMVVVWAVWSDRLKKRSLFILLGLCFCLVGFAINVSNVPLGVKYFGTFLVVIGGYAGFPAIPSWLGNNLVGHYRRGTGLAIQAISGQVGGIIASNIYRTQDEPRYITGHIAELALVVMGLLVVPMAVAVYARTNSRRDAMQREASEKGSSQQYSPEELRKLADRAPDFRYTL
ncbi:MFS general substrate transporter [Cubamyces menziesii]|nr:MFS general substrate transporter [Cubamyces menziesii]